MKTTSVADRVRGLRKALGLNSQEELARLLGVSFQTVNRWENGQATPSGLADSLLDCLHKIVASGQALALVEEFRSGAFGGGSSRAFHRIYSLAFGVPAVEPAHRKS
ncbi:MAG: helix-turn-helix transcriptional regulator [Elusimicrobia bacterium]|nr:helix-turn-helix transcriptional regulator [Elusimicrobiota bacterium]